MRREVSRIWVWVPSLSNFLVDDSAGSRATWPSLARPAKDRPFDFWRSEWDRNANNCRGILRSRRLQACESGLYVAVGLLDIQLLRARPWHWPWSSLNHTAGIART
jgi:hypothetical protein